MDLPEAPRLGLAAHLGAPGDARLELRPPPAEGAAADRLLASAPRPLVGLVPGAEWATKRWPADRWAALARRLGGTAVVLGGPAERPLGAALREALGPAAVDTTGNSIDDALALLARCDVVVGGDSGLTHCARALGRPCLTLFGPTYVDRHRFGERDAALALGLACQPCHGHGPRACPLGHHDCLGKLGVERVAEAARRLLA